MLPRQRLALLAQKLVQPCLVLIDPHEVEAAGANTAFVGGGASAGAESRSSLSPRGGGGGRRVGPSAAHACTSRLLSDHRDGGYAKSCR